MATYEELKSKMNGKEKHAGCLCCKGSEDILDFETTLHNGFGGWHISKDKEIYFMDSSKDCFENWDNIKKLKDIEEEARKEPDSEWQAHYIAPLREAKYQRSDCGKWVLIETGPGFA